MNKGTKILLSIMIVSLCVLIIPLNGYGKSIKTKSVSLQVMPSKTVENQIKVSMNFKIDMAIKEMNQKMAEIEGIEDKKKWFVLYKNIINEYSYIIDPPETIYDYFTEEELILLFSVVQAEVGDEYSFEQKANVASVVFNRLEHERFSNTLSEILVYDQFSPISDGRYKEVVVSEDTILACEYVFSVSDTTNGCLFFDSNNSLNYEFVFFDGAHNFYKYREE